MKAVLPTLKQKKRYVVFEVVSESPIESYEPIRDSIWQGCHSFLGELGMAEAGIRLLDDEFDPKKQRGIIKVNHKHVDRLGSALMMIQKIGRNNAIVRTIGVSGILDKAEERYIIN
jgi:ribonuclease P/MRP protein subunit POP5